MHGQGGYLLFHSYGASRSEERDGPSSHLFIFSRTGNGEQSMQADAQEQSISLPSTSSRGFDLDLRKGRHVMGQLDHDIEFR